MRQAFFWQVNFGQNPYHHIRTSNDSLMWILQEVAFLFLLRISITKMSAMRTETRWCVWFMRSMLPSKRKTRTKSRRPAFRLNRFSANRTILRQTDRTTFRRKPNFTMRHARRNCRELFRFHLQRQSSEQSSNALYVPLPQSKFGRSMLAVRKADCERSLHVFVHRKTGNHRPAQARLYWNRAALSNQRRQQHTAIQDQELSHQHQGVTLALWWSGGGVTLDWQRERNNRTGV